MWRSEIVCMVLLTASCIHCSVLFFKPKEAVVIESESKAIVCPDGGECPVDTTCCLLTTGKYGCCPLPHAVCCDDREHCCPSGHTCDVEHQQCLQGSSVVKLSAISSLEVKVLPATSVANTQVTETCADQSECPDGTCCLLASGAYGCCPYREAVCCEDEVHCCPNGYKCNILQQTCDMGFHKIAFQSPAKALKPKDVPCPGGQSTCPDNTTCCVLASGDYGCCPYPDAVCCEDKEHCCPNGYKCNVAQQTCDKGAFRISFSAPVKSSVTDKDVTCPDGETCPDGSTCCVLDSGAYGCCPFSEAVCCDDKQHCCPQGHVCNLAQQTCDTSFTLTTKLTLTKKPLTTSVNDVPCPGGEAACPDGSTCCQMSSGQYGCCPLPQAVCCDDHTHCCPEGYKCDTAAGACLHGVVSVPWSRKVPARSAPISANLADTKDCQCNSGSTCCNQKCCPFENAKCCADGLHCCPAGTSCDAESRMCQSVTNSLKVTWHQMPKKTAIAAELHVAETVDCPDASHCDDGETCCKLTSSGYGCCPLDQAVCCSDGLHCCPHGTQCDLEHSTCVQSEGVSGIVLPWELHSRRRSQRP